MESLTLNNIYAILAVISAIVIIALVLAPPRIRDIIASSVALLLVGTFTIGLTHSISKGSAGFLNWGGGVIIAIIVTVVLLCVLFDSYDTTIRKKQ